MVKGSTLQDETARLIYERNFAAPTYGHRYVIEFQSSPITTSWLFN